MCLLSVACTISCGLRGLRELKIIFWIGRTSDFTRVIFYLIYIDPWIEMNKKMMYGGTDNEKFFIYSIIFNHTMC